MESDDAAVLAGVVGDLVERGRAGADDDLVADLLVVGQPLGLDGRGRAEQGDAAAGEDALLERRAGGVQGVLDAGLLLLHLALGRGPDVDLGHAAGQLGQPLLELLAVVVALGVGDLAADRLDAALDRLVAAGALDDGRVVLVDQDLLGAAQVIEADVLQLDAQRLEDRLAAGQDGDVLEHGLAAVAVARAP